MAPWLELPSVVQSGSMQHGPNASSSVPWENMDQTLHTLCAGPTGRRGCVVDDQSLCDTCSLECFYGFARTRLAVLNSASCPEIPELL